MRRLSLPIALGTTFALAVAGVAGAAVVTPPAGTPDLAAMVLQPGDLAPGAVLGAQGYIKPPSGLTAEYDSSFTSAATPDGVSYLLLSDNVALASTTTAASDYFDGERDAFDTSKGRKLLVRDIIARAGKKSVLKAKDLKFSAAGSAGVGTSSFIETLTISVKHTKSREVIVLLNEGTVNVILALTGKINESVPHSDAIALAGDIDTHIDAVLSASGASGASGTTGVSG